MTLLRSRTTDAHTRLFQAHYRAPNRVATSTQLSSWASIDGGHPVVNSLYGKLGHAFCDTLGIRPELRPDDSHRWWSGWSRGWNTPGGFVWQMLPQVAEAIEQLGWVSSAEFTIPEEVPSDVVLVEGAVRRVTVNGYERNPEARRRCIAAHGSNCCICEFNFGAVYGSETEGYIHVHHVRSLSEIGGEYEVDPVEDLRPVCPNCHAVLHLGGRCRSIEEVRQLLRPQRHT
jgi:5-methylcytosine-specific restriction protein A